MEPTEVELRHKLEERLRFEALLTEIFERFINLPTDKIDGEIEDALKMLVDYGDLSSAII